MKVHASSSAPIRNIISAVPGQGRGIDNVASVDMLAGAASALTSFRTGGGRSGGGEAAQAEAAAMVTA
jgi:hypothetical protein